MNIALDYDDTITRDENAWRHFCDYFRAFGHKVYIVTWRSDAEAIDVKLRWNNSVDGIYCTNRGAKSNFMYRNGVRIDVWIDDNPSAILYSQETSFHPWE